MRIGLISTAVPLVYGGGRQIVDWLHEKMQERGIASEVVYIPYTDELSHILPQITAFRMMHLDDYFDRVITFRPPAHFVRHRSKVLWFIHHLRMFYDLWGTMYCPVPMDVAGYALRRAIIEADNTAFAESEKVFTNSQVVSDRIAKFNAYPSKVLYPPVFSPESFRAGEYGEEIVSVCRMEHHKRQHLLVEALAHSRTPVRLRLCGSSLSPVYVADLQAQAVRLGIGDRLMIEDRWIKEEEKVDRLEGALASAYVPFDEDSYGYPTIEAGHARRCTITVNDAGGVMEFVEDGVTGLIAEPSPQALGEIYDRLYNDRMLARRLGDNSAEKIKQLGIDWDTVIDSLLS
jgi:glycosyltransferase involved in cell wall biosynthesis